MTAIQIIQAIRDELHKWQRQAIINLESDNSRFNEGKLSLINDMYDYLLDLETEGVKEGINIKETLESLRQLGYKPRWIPDMKAITFYYHGNKVTLYCRTEYFSGKGIASGHGVQNLIEQIKLQ